MSSRGDRGALLEPQQSSGGSSSVPHMDGTVHFHTTGEAREGDEQLASYSPSPQPQFSAPKPFRCRECSRGSIDAFPLLPRSPLVIDGFGGFCDWETFTEVTEEKKQRDLLLQRLLVNSLVPQGLVAGENLGDCLLSDDDLHSDCDNSARSSNDESRSSDSLPVWLCECQAESTRLSESVAAMLRLTSCGSENICEEVQSGQCIQQSNPPRASRPSDDLFLLDLTGVHRPLADGLASLRSYDNASFGVACVQSGEDPSQLQGGSEQKPEGMDDQKFPNSSTDRTKFSAWVSSSVIDPSDAEHRHRQKVWLDDSMKEPSLHSCIVPGRAPTDVSLKPPIGRYLNFPAASKTHEVTRSGGPLAGHLSSLGMHPRSNKGSEPKKIGRPRLDRSNIRCPVCGATNTSQWRYLLLSMLIEFAFVFSISQEKLLEKVGQVVNLAQRSSKVCLCNACWLRVKKRKSASDNNSASMPISRASEC